MQVLTDNGQARFAVNPFAAFDELHALQTDEEKLADYLDYLYTQKVKAQRPVRLKLAEVKAALALD